MERSLNPCSRVGPCRVRVQRAVSSQRSAIWSMLAPAISHLYPGATDWLDRKLCLDDRNETDVLTAMVGSEIVGLAISTSKGRRSRKLSSIWVPPQHRRLGYGSLLSQHVIARWTESGAESGYVTVAEQSLREVEALLNPLGFTFLCTDRERYGEQRDEHVLSWSADRFSPPASVSRS
jgi:ribosomal protein S18 acetylase RimI-like enzyme